MRSSLLKSFFGGYMSHLVLRFLGYCGGASVAVQTACRYSDSVEGTDPFSQHSAKQHQKHPFSGMHEPFFPSPEQREFCSAHFPEHTHLVPVSPEVFAQQQALETSVKIRSLASCPERINFEGAGTVVVGGPPALISSANESNVTYINDKRRHPIAKGSAFHLEWDAESEAPTSYLPTQFMANQIFRALFHYESLKQAEKTGQFSWRSLDWVGWIRHPSHWLEGIRVGIAFQRAVSATLGKKEREALMEECSQRCKANQKFYEQLNVDLENKLLLPGSGSVIVARTEGEKQALIDMKEGLKKEGRTLTLLSSGEFESRYGFVPPEGIAFGEKTHDAVLSPDFMELLANRIETLGGKVINGTLQTIYTCCPNEGGVVEYQTFDGKKHYVPFSNLVLSLGNQRILGADDKPIFDVVTARGVSALAIAYVPKGRGLPPVLVCGGTNHATKLSEPITVQKDDGNSYDAYLLRMTGAACITPNVSEKDSANYDGTAAVGLISAVRKTLDCEVEVITVYGCNRQVSEYGQSHWISPPIGDQPTSSFLAPRGHYLDQGTHRLDSRTIKVQMGAGGGGLTQGPAQPPLKGFEIDKQNRS